MSDALFWGLVLLGGLGAWLLLSLLIGIPLGRAMRDPR